MPYDVTGSTRPLSHVLPPRKDSAERFKRAGGRGRGGIKTGREGERREVSGGRLRKRKRMERDERKE